MANNYIETHVVYINNSYEVRDYINKSLKEGWEVVAVIPRLNTNSNSGINGGDNVNLSLQINMTYEIMLRRTELGKEIYGN